MPDSHARLARPPEEHRYWLERALERTTGFEPATPNLAMARRMSHASPPVSPVLLSCAFFAALSHPSHQIARVDSIPLVTSLVLSRHGRPILRRKATTQRNCAVGKAHRQGEAPILPFSGHLTASMV